jgi:hypothetical protein
MWNCAPQFPSVTPLTRDQVRRCVPHGFTMMIPSVVISRRTRNNRHQANKPNAAATAVATPAETTLRTSGCESTLSQADTAPTAGAAANTWPPNRPDGPTCHTPMTPPRASPTAPMVLTPAFRRNSKRADPTAVQQSSTATAVSPSDCQQLHGKSSGRRPVGCLLPGGDRSPGQSAMSSQGSRTGRRCQYQGRVVMSSADTWPTAVRAEPASARVSSR